MNNGNQTALITGAAHRLGSAIARQLHDRGVNIAIHCGKSLKLANDLNKQLNNKRGDSSFVFQQDLTQEHAADNLVKNTIEHFSRLDFLVNNAALFYPTPIIEFKSKPESEPALTFEGKLHTSKAQQLEEQLLSVNLIQARKLLIFATPFLMKNHGAAVNIIDIYAKTGLAKHCHYVASKAALLELTKEYAKKFAPEIRINSVSPGAILWPENNEKSDTSQQQTILENSALKRLGTTEEIAKTVTYLLLDATYTTGSNINVDGGRRLYL